MPVHITYTTKLRRAPLAAFCIPALKDGVFRAVWIKSLYFYYIWTGVSMYAALAESIAAS